MSVETFLNDTFLSDLVLFEIPSQDEAELLRERLRPRWPGWAQRSDGLWLVAARPREDGGDLAALLREVETWVLERGLRVMRFHLDDRHYILEPRDASASVAA